MKCMECKKKATEHHHIIPKSLGGKTTIPLCGSCHAKVHGMDAKRRDSHSELTKLGLQRARERGVILGKPKNFTQEGRLLAHEVVKKNAIARNKRVVKFLKSFHFNKYSLRELAYIINKKGIKTSKGFRFQATSVKRVLDRYLNDTDIKICKHTLYENEQGEMFCPLCQPPF